MSETETRCGHAVVDKDGDEQPCDRPASGWRWYQDVEHEDCLEAACSIHENVGGNRLHAAEAERDRLRGVVEAVQALHALDDHGWCRECSTSPCRTAAALASVPSSGEAESGEAVGDRWDGTPLYRCASCGLLTVNEPPRVCAGCESREPAPAVSGGQAGGEGVRLRDDERDAIALAKHRTWHIACDGRCGGTLNDWISVDRELVPAVERILTARLAARPVLSREALTAPFGYLEAVVADAVEGMAASLPELGPPVRVQRCYAGGIARAALRAVAAVLVGQEER